MELSVQSPGSGSTLSSHLHMYTCRQRGCSTSLKVCNWHKKEDNSTVNVGA